MSSAPSYSEFITGKKFMVGGGKTASESDVFDLLKKLDKAARMSMQVRDAKKFVRRNTLKNLPEELKKTTFGMLDFLVGPVTEEEAAETAENIEKASGGGITGGLLRGAYTALVLPDVASDKILKEVTGASEEEIQASVGLHGARLLIGALLLVPRAGAKAIEAISAKVAGKAAGREFERVAARTFSREVKNLSEKDLTKIMSHTVGKGDAEKVARAVKAIAEDKPLTESELRLLESVAEPVVEKMGGPSKAVANILAFEQLKAVRAMEDQALRKMGLSPDVRPKIIRELVTNRAAPAPENVRSAIESLIVKGEIRPSGRMSKSAAVDLAHGMRTRLQVAELVPGRSAGRARFMLRGGKNLPSSIGVKLDDGMTRRLESIGRALADNKGSFGPEDFDNVLVSLAKSKDKNVASQARKLLALEDDQRQGAFRVIFGSDALEGRQTRMAHVPIDEEEQRVFFEVLGEGSQPKPQASKVASSVSAPPTGSVKDTDFVIPKLKLGPKEVNEGFVNFIRKRARKIGNGKITSSSIKAAIQETAESNSKHSGTAKALLNAGFLEDKEMRRQFIQERIFGKAGKERSAKEIAAEEAEELAEEFDDDAVKAAGEGEKSLELEQLTSSLEDQPGSITRRVMEYTKSKGKKALSLAANIGAFILADRLLFGSGDKEEKAGEEPPITPQEKQGAIGEFIANHIGRVNEAFKEQAELGNIEAASTLIQQLASPGEELMNKLAMDAHVRSLIGDHALSVAERQAVMRGIGDPAVLSVLQNARKYTENPDAAVHVPVPASFVFPTDHQVLTAGLGRLGIRPSNLRVPEVDAGMKVLDQAVMKAYFDAVQKMRASQVDQQAGQQQGAPQPQSGAQPQPQPQPQSGAQGG